MKLILVMLMFMSKAIYGSEDLLPEVLQGPRLEKHIECLSCEEGINALKQEFNLERSVLHRNIWYLERIAGFFAYFSIMLMVREWWKSK